jgi:hypothetical protein
MFSHSNKAKLTISTEQLRTSIKSEFFTSGMARVTILKMRRSKAAKIYAFPTEHSGTAQLTKLKSYTCENDNFSHEANESGKVVKSKKKHS